MSIIYKLFRCERCFDDDTHYGEGQRNRNVNKVFLTSDRKMTRLLRIIQDSTKMDKYTYYIEKYRNNKIITRKVPYVNTFDYNERETILSSTWEKYVYNDGVWSASNHRYYDEL